MYDEFDDYAYEDDSLMEEIDDILYDEEYERTLYEVNVCEINDYWDRENEYIRSSGIYSDEEVEQILENHNRIRNEKIAEATEDYERELEWIREQKEWAAQDSGNGKTANMKDSWHWKRPRKQEWILIPTTSEAGTILLNRASPAVC